MRGRTIRRALLAAVIWLVAVLLPGGAALAVTCPSAANGETLNIVTSGGVTTCTNIGTAKATTGIEILNALGDFEYHLLPDGFSFFRFGVSFRRAAAAGNEQPTALSCVGACRPLMQPSGQEPFDQDVEIDMSRTVSQFSAYDWLFGNGTVTLANCFTGLGATHGCTINFQFSDGTQGSFVVSAGSTTIPSFNLGGILSFPPRITSVSPSKGLVGSTLTIIGSGLSSVTAVHNNEVNNFALPFTVVSDAEIRVTAATCDAIGRIHGPWVGSPSGSDRYRPESAHIFYCQGGPIAITTATLPSAAPGVSYTATVTASGGSGEVLRSYRPAVPYKFSATGLPNGLALDAATGRISGTPTASGVFTVAISAEDTYLNHEAYGHNAGDTGTKTFTLTVGAPPSLTTTTLPPGSAGSPYSAPLAASGGIAPYTFTATGLLPGLSVVGGAITGTPTQMGNSTAQITVTDSTPAGSGGPLVSTPVGLALNIGQGSQTITFTSAVPASPVVGGSYTVTATGGASGNPVTLSIDPASTTNACAIAGNVVSFTGVGTCLVVADQAHNAHYGTAEPVRQSITVGKGAQAVAFTSTVPASPVVGGSYAVTATGGASGNAVTFAIDAASTPGTCSISGATVSFAAPGTCLVNANQAGSPNYNAAPQVQQSIAVGKAAQTLAFTSSVPATPLVGGTYTVTATGGASGNPVTFSIDAASTVGACTIAGATVSFTGAGTCLVNANQAGNANYNAAAPVQRAMTVGKASQTVAFTSTVPASPVVGGSYAVTATGGASGNPVLFSIDAASTAGACTIAGNTVTFSGSGTCLIDANQAGNASYSAAPQVQQTVAVAKSSQAITFAKPADQTFGGAPLTLSASATSGLAVTFASTTAEVCTVAGNSATLLAAGTCSITASQPGNNTWLAAPDVVQSFSVGKSAQTISFAKPADVLFAPGATVALAATSSSGLPVAFASQTTGVCSVAGTTATIVAIGACSIKASQGGNANFAAAADVTQIFNTLGEPKITATATASPATFSRVGQSLVFTVVLANSGNVAATGLSVAEARLGTLACASATLPAGGTVACQGSTTTTAADLAARSISIAPRVTYSYGAPPAATLAAARLAQASSSTAVTVTVELAVTVAATVDVAAVQQATRSAIQGFLAQRGQVLASSGPDTSRLHGRLTGGSLFGGASEGDREADAPAASFARTTARSDPFQRFGLGGSLGSSGGGLPDASLGHGGDPAHLLASPFDRFARGAPRGLGSSLEQQPALPLGMQREWPDSQPERRAAPQGFAFGGQGDDSGGRFQFSTSLAKFRAATEAAEREKRAGLDPALGLGPAGSRRGAADGARPPLFDVWLEASSTYFRTDHPDGRRQGHAAVVAAGADVLLRPGLLVGLMAQVDWMADSADGKGQARDGRGWMAGPYLSARLTPSLYFDARAAWGRSSNHIDPLGAYIDTFETARALASAKLTGDWASGDWRLRPSAEVIWFEETQAEYTNALGISIAANSYHLGRATGGPEVGYRMTLGDGATLEPFAGAKAVWDFAVGEQTTAAGQAIGHDGLRARLEGGLALRIPAGISLRATGAYDGLGSDGYRAVQGQARVTVPLQ